MVYLSHEGGWCRIFAHWIKAASRTKYGTLPLNSYRELAEALNISETATIKYTKAFLHAGLCDVVISRDGKKHLRFKSVDKMSDRYENHLGAIGYKDNKSLRNKFVYIKSECSVTEIVQQLKSRVIIRKIQQQRYAEVERRKSLTYSRLRNVDAKLPSYIQEFLMGCIKSKVPVSGDAGANQFKNIDPQCKQQNFTFLSDEYSADMLYMSVTSYKRLKVAMKREGILSIEKVDGRLLKEFSHSRIPLDIYLELKEGGAFNIPTFWHKGRVYETPKTNYIGEKHIHISTLHKLEEQLEQVLRIDSEVCKYLNNVNRSHVRPVYKGRNNK